MTKLLSYLLLVSVSLSLGACDSNDGDENSATDQFVGSWVLTGASDNTGDQFDTISQSIDWDLNPNFSYQLAAETVWYHFKSVLTEELIFRGALLYILIKKIGLQAGLIISSVAFGVYHWFSYGALGALVPMIYVFITTASMGYVWAWAFARTRSIMLGLGMHLGWNVMGAIFSTGPSGDLLFIEQSRVAFSDWNNLWYLLGKGLAVPILTILLLSYFWPPQSPAPQVKPSPSEVDTE